MKSHIRITSFLILLLSAFITGCDEDNEPIEPTNGLMADAGADNSVFVNENVQLDGSGSHDKGKKPFSYLWSIKSKPSGSLAEISSTQIANPLFKANAAGDYVIQLQILQDQRSAKDELTIHVQNNLATAIVLHEAIMEDTQLEDVFTDPSEADYIVTADIEVRGNLVVNPGVVIAFTEGKSLQVIAGSLQSRGTAANPIVFKGTGEGAAYWKGILIHTNNNLNALEYTTVQQGGSSAFSEIGSSANIALEGTNFSGAALHISNSTITTGGGYGLYVKGSSSISDFRGNTFTNNAEAAAYIPARQLHRLEEGNQAFYNGFNGAETGGALEEADLTWRKAFGVYLVTSNIVINRGLNLDAGIVLAMNDDVSITVSPTGYLKAIGTPNNKIVFASTSVTHYWKGLAINSISPNNILDYCTVSNGGHGRFADADQSGNVVVGAAAFVSVKNSLIRNSNGYGIVTKNLANLNADVLTTNAFENLSQGKTYPASTQSPDRPSLTGIWVDRWTFDQGKSTIDTNLYDRENGEWFGGASEPYLAANAGFGLKIGDDGKFVWTNVEYFPVVDCRSFTADYMTGEAAVLPDNTLTLNLDYWRSMFISGCDPTHNLDTGVEPSLVTLRYEITEMSNLWTGERYWELKFFRPDNSTYSFYRR